jgi:hypothetical protein
LSAKWGERKHLEKDEQIKTSLRLKKKEELEVSNALSAA